MIKRSKFTGHEVAAAVLEDGSVVVFRDYANTEGLSYVYVSSSKKNADYFKGIKVKSYFHTHPFTAESINWSGTNPLRVSSYDQTLASDIHAYTVNILLLDGNYYSIEGDNLSQVNFEYNIYNK